MLQVFYLANKHQPIYSTISTIRQDELNSGMSDSLGCCVTVGPSGPTTPVPVTNECLASRGKLYQLHSVAWQ